MRVAVLLVCPLGWSLIGDGVSHAVLPGVVLAYAFGWPFAVGATVFAFIAVALMGLLRGTSPIKEDAVIGIVFTTLFALGVVLVSVVPSQIDLNHILFGSLLGVSPADAWQVIVIALVVIVILLVERRDLTAMAFDAAHLHAIGISPRRLSALLLALLGLTVVIAVQAVGVVLVVAMLIVPGSTAFLLTRRFGRMLVVAPVMSALCTVAGLYTSYYTDVPPGGAIVLVQAGAFTVVYVARPWRGRVLRAVSR